MLKKNADLVFVLVFAILSVVIALGIFRMLKEFGLHHDFVSSLKEYSIDGLLVFLGIALAANYKSEAGKVCFFYMIVGVALMIVCHLVLQGLPDHNVENQVIRRFYAIFGSLFYIGITVSLSTACLGLYRRDTKE